MGDAIVYTALGISSVVQLASASTAPNKQTNTITKKRIDLLFITNGINIFVLDKHICNRLNGKCQLISLDFSEAMQLSL